MTVSSVAQADLRGVWLSASLQASGTEYTIMVNNVMDNAGNAIADDSTVTFTAGAAPWITSQPSYRALRPGECATFSVLAEGTAPLSYQWRRNGTAIAGATDSSYILSNV